jgi:hypothetical protein
MTRIDSRAYRFHGFLTLGLAGGTLALGYLLEPQAPDWVRWLIVVAAQVGLGAATAAVAGRERAVLRRLLLKTLLWPTAAAGLAGAARLAGIEIYQHVDRLGVIALGLAHTLGEGLLWSPGAGVRAAREAGHQLLPQLRWPPEPATLEAWLIDTRWMLAIAAVPWCWDLIANRRLDQFLAAGALFLWLVRLPERPQGPPRVTEEVESVIHE